MFIIKNSVREVPITDIVVNTLKEWKKQTIRKRTNQYVTAELTHQHLLFLQSLVIENLYLNSSITKYLCFADLGRQGNFLVHL